MSTTLPYHQIETTQQSGHWEQEETLPHHILDRMLRQVKAADLIETLTKKLRDPLIRYTRDGIVDPLMVPNKHYIVAITYELSLLMQEHGWAIVLENGMIYVYNDVYWEKMSENIIRRFLVAVALKLGFYSNVEAMTSPFQKVLLQQFLDLLPIKEHAQHKDIVLINLKNGTFEASVNGGYFREHHQEDFLTYVLPFEYDPKATAPLYQAYLNRVLPDTSTQTVLQEFHGYIFTRHLKLEKALLLYGDGSNGKSVQFEITRSLLGDHNVETKTIADLTSKSGEYSRAELKDKLLNYGSEIHAKSMEIDVLKRLISGEPVMAREIYKRVFTLQNTCKFIFNANRLPETEEQTHAFFRRFIIIPYKETISESEADPQLHRKIVQSELSGIFNWVIEGLYRLLKENGFSQSDQIEHTLQEYKKEMDSVALFLEDKELVPSDEGRIPNDTLYPMYRKWCVDHKKMLLGKGALSKDLKKKGFRNYKSGSVRGFFMKTEVSNETD